MIAAPAAGLVLVLLAGAATAALPAEIRGRLLTGDRAGARHLADSLAATATEIDPELEFLRALLAEDARAMEAGLRSVLRADPEGAQSGRAHLKLGRLAFVEEDFAAAAEHFRLARENGRGEEGSLWEGLAAFAMGDVARARESLERATESGNARIRQRARLALGDLARLARNDEDAIHQYEEIRGEEPAGAWWAAATYRTAVLREEQGKRAEATALLSELLERRPAAYEAPLARARLRFEVEFDPGQQLAAELADTVAAPVRGSRPWAVQAGAFSLPANAELLAGDLRAGGFPEVRVISADQLHRVLVGRFGERSEAEALGDSLVDALDTGFRIVRTDLPE